MGCLDLRSFEAAFRDGWVPVEGNAPRTLTTEQSERVQQIIESGGGWLHGPDPVLMKAVRDGARPGETIPPREGRPFITRVHDADVRIVSTGPDRRVAVIFSHEDFPDVRFGHRFKPNWGSDAKLAEYEDINLMEEVETSALHHMMKNPPASGENGVIWTTWGAK